MDCHVSSARLPRKFPGIPSAYDGVFSGEFRVSSREEDYAEVFAGGGAAIPVLDLPCFREGRLRVDVRRSSLDYAMVFGGEAAGGFAASFEEVARRGARAKAGVGRVKQRSLSLTSNNGLDEASVEEASVLSSNEAKIFNVSYSKSNVGSNGKSNGTVHVAPLADIPGYSVFGEENGLLNRVKVNSKQVLKGEVDDDAGGRTVRDVNCQNVPSGVSVKIPVEQSSRKDMSQRRLSIDGSFPDEMLFDRCGFMVGKNSYREEPPYNVSSASFDKEKETVGSRSPSSVSEGIDHSYSPPDLGCQLDANSAAAASVAALKIAIEKAQARIKAAKERMEGKKVFDFEVRTEKKLDNEDKKSCKKVKKEFQNPKMLHEKVCDVDMEGHSLSGIPKPDSVSGEMGDKVKESTSEESNVIMLQENCDKIGADCWKAEVGNREEEDLFEDARVEPYHPTRDELREETGVKIENKSFNVLVFNCDISSSGNSAVGVDAEAALDEVLSHEKANPPLLTSEGAEQIIPFEVSEELNRNKENTPDNYVVSDDFESVKKFAFHFHATPFENLPELKIPRPNVDHEPQQLIEHNLVKCAAESCANGEGLNDESGIDMREDHGMRLGNDEVGEQQEQYSDFINNEMQLEEPCSVGENNLEHPAASFGEKPINEVSEVSDPATPKERNDQLAVKSYDNCREVREFEESPDCKEDESGETILPNGNQVEDIEIQPPQNCDITETAKVPADIKTRRRHWTVEAQDVSRLINALAANACEPNVHEQLIGTPRGYGHRGEQTANYSTDDIEKEDSDGTSMENAFPDLGTPRGHGHGEDQTANNITDDIEKEDSDGTLIENSLPKLGSEECLSSEVGRDSITEEKQTDEPIDDTLYEEISQGEDVAEAFNSRENTANVEYACMDCQLTDDEASDGSFQDDSSAQLASREFEDSKFYEAEFSYCGERESEASAKEANSENGVEFSSNDLCCPDEMVMEMQQLDDDFTEKQETQTVEVGMDDDKTEDHETAQTTEEVTAESPEIEMQFKQSGNKNVEEKEKEQAREKEKLAVERAIQEARQRAYAEAKQRAERAAVEKATSEARQRGMAQAREKVGKTSPADPSNKADEQRSAKAKIQAERAAVERATAEARERALEKALAEKLAAGNRDNKPGKKSHEQHHRSSGSSGSSRHQSTSDPSGNTKGDSGESARRRKTWLERHQRTAERAAKALAEKNKRDLLAQQEQAERNRLAETLDSEIKRWSSGKQGNLRSLLSTLQYILGPDSGWQPVTLTEIITNAAVKKAYRKATLYVHPDKLQQRGASLQQKYICEKVFDLLKDAWNKFSAEER